MPFSDGDRIHLLNSKTYGGKVISAGTCGTIMGYQSLLDTYTVQFDGDVFIRVATPSDLAVGCP